MNSTEQRTSKGILVDLLDLYPNTEYNITVQQRSMSSSIDSKVWNWIALSESQERSDMEMWSPPLTLNILTLPAGEYNPITSSNFIITVNIIIIIKRKQHS